MPATATRPITRKSERRKADHDDAVNERYDSHGLCCPSSLARILQAWPDDASAHDHRSRHCGTGLLGGRTPGCAPDRRSARSRTRQPAPMSTRQRKRNSGPRIWNPLSADPCTQCMVAPRLPRGDRALAPGVARRCPPAQRPGHMARRTRGTATSPTGTHDAPDGPTGQAGLADPPDLRAFGGPGGRGLPSRTPAAAGRRSTGRPDSSDPQCCCTPSGNGTPGCAAEDPGRRGRSAVPAGRRRTGQAQGNRHSAERHLNPR